MNKKLISQINLDNNMNKQKSKEEMVTIQEPPVQPSLKLNLPNMSKERIDTSYVSQHKDTKRSIFM